jgi:hypothetical protein
MQQKEDNVINADTNKTVHSMDKQLKVWHFILASFAVLVTVMTMIINQSNKIETQGLRITYLESAQRDNSLLLKEMNGKLTEILIQLQNKRDKKDATP